MSDKKRANQDDLEKEISQIVQDFQNIVGEITDTANVRQFTNIYRQLHDLLMDSHDKNNKLTTAAQALNAEIIANATKVSALLKMSEDDHKAIDKYKDEFEKARRLVVSSQEKEMKAKEICEQMKSQVDKLAAEVHEQSVSEAKFADMKVDLTNFKDEAQRNEKEINVLQAEIEKLKRLVADCNTAIESSQTESKALEESIDIESEQLEGLKNSKMQYYNQIEKTKISSDASQDESNEITRKIANSKTNIDDLSRKLENQRSKLNEARNDCNISIIKKRERQASLDLVLNHQNTLNSNIQRVKQNLESHQRTIDSERVHIEGIDSAIKESKQGLDEITKYRDNLAHELRVTGKEKRDKVDEIIGISRNYSIQDNNMKTVERQNDSTQRNIHQVKMRVDQEKNNTKELKDLSKLVDAQINAEKMDIETLNSYAHSLETESKMYMKQAGESIVNTVRFSDNLMMTRAEIESSNYLLHSIEVQSKDHEKIVQNMRKDRDIISNQIIGIEKENQELLKKINSAHEEIQKLKVMAQEKTSDCIKEHFRSRSLEKQNVSLTEMVDLTKKMTQEMNSTVIKFKSEATKLNLIIMESQKDITHASAELKNITDVITMLKSQLDQRQTEIDEQKVKVSSLMYELDHKGFNYSENQKKYREMESEMSALMAKNRKLQNRAAVLASLTLEKISLDSALLHERELRNRYEQELMRPLNVHRWTIMAAMNPDRYKQIQMIQYLKNKIEGVEKQRIKLLSKKHQVLEEIEKVKTRAKNARFIDEDVAFDNIKKSIKKKEQEMEEAQKETEVVKAQAEQLKEAIADLRGRLKETKTKSLAIKQKNQALQGPQIPTLPINMKPVEMLRLGGGFSLETPRAQTARAEAVNPMYVNDHDDEAPRTGRSGSVTSRSKRSDDRSYLRRKNSEQKVSRKPLTARQKADIAEQRISDLYPYEAPASARRQKSESSRSETANFGRRSNISSADPYYNDTASSSRQSELDNMTITSSRRQSELDSFTITSSRRQSELEKKSTGRRSNYEEPGSARRQKPEIETLNIPNSNKKSSRLYTDTYNEPVSARRYNTSRREDKSDLSDKNSSRRIESNLESLPFSSRRKTDSNIRTNSDYDHLNMPSSARKQSASNSGRSTEMDPLQLQISMSSRMSTEPPVTMPPVALTETNVESSRRPPSARRMEKNTISEHLWAPQIVHEKKQIDEIPELTITSARRQKAESAKKRRPMKTAKRPN